MAAELGPDMDGQWPIAKDTMLVTCDRVVVHDGVVREKPESKDEAREFIRGTECRRRQPSAPSW